MFSVAASQVTVGSSAANAVKGIIDTAIRIERAIAKIFFDILILIKSFLVLFFPYS